MAAATTPRREADPLPLDRPLPRVGLLSASLRYWPIVVLCVAAFTAAGVAAALRRAPTYTAEARLSVGRIDVSAPGALGSFAVAAQALAAQYSRTVAATGVTKPTARKVGLSPAAVAARVGASPIPQSPIVRVSAIGASENDAVRLANAASSALVAYTTKLNRSNPDGARLLAQYRVAARRLVRADAALRRARAAFARARSRARRQAIEDARVDQQVAALQVNTVRTAYDNSTQSQAATALMQVIAPATAATSDRRRYAELFGFIGFVVGLALGLTIASLWAGRVIRRRLLR